MSERIKPRAISLKFKPYAVLTAHAAARGISRRELIEELLSEYEPFGTRKLQSLLPEEERLEPTPITLQGSAVVGADRDVARVLAMSDEEIDAELRAEGRDPQQVADETRKVLEEAVRSWENNKPKRRTRPWPDEEIEPREPPPRPPVRPEALPTMKPNKVDDVRPYTEPEVTGRGYGQF